MKEFTKKDLKPGMVVEHNDGSRKLVLNDRLIGTTPIVGWNIIQKN